MVIVTISPVTGEIVGCFDFIIDNIETKDDKEGQDTTEPKNGCDRPPIIELR
jgi:hypothetical protein